MTGQGNKYQESENQVGKGSFICQGNQSGVMEAETFETDIKGSVKYLWLTVQKTNPGLSPIMGDVLGGLTIFYVRFSTGE